MPAPTHTTCSMRLTQEAQDRSNLRFGLFLVITTCPVIVLPVVFVKLGFCLYFCFCRTLLQLCPSCSEVPSQRSSSGPLTSTISTEMVTLTKRFVLVYYLSQLCVFFFHSSAVFMFLCACILLHRRWQTLSEQYTTWWGSTRTQRWKRMHPNSMWMPSFRFQHYHSFTYI